MTLHTRSQTKLKRTSARLLLVMSAFALMLNTLYPSPLFRALSIDYGNGTCLWQPPAYDVPDDLDFFKTMVVGYPRSVISCVVNQNVFEDIG